jgi:hypothetical protein
VNEITLFYFDGCPSWQSALENLEKVLESEQIPAQITLVKIDSDAQAQKEHFLGSPSIRVNGVDLWPEERANYSLSCRVYHTPMGMRGSPTLEMLREKLHSLLLHKE